MGVSTDGEERAAAFDAFCAAEYRQLVGVTHLIVGDLAVAEELVQAALEKAWLRWDRVRDMASPGGWVQRVASNDARSTLRRRAAERRALQRHASGAAAAPPVDSATVMAVRQALLSLPRRQREVLVHRHVAGRTVAETAQAMGISEAATTQLTYRASQRLRQLLPEEKCATTTEEREHG
jgi:RNA polymerase sigma factor (sigma-70 family)